LLAAIATCLFFGSVTASAAPLATIDSRAPTLESGDSGGSTVKLGFTNLTDGQVEFKATPSKASPGCSLTPEKTQLPYAEHTEITLTVPASCKATEGITIDVALATGSAAPQEFVVNPTVTSAAATPDWDQLWAFAIALVASLLLVGILYGWWSHNNERARGPTQPLISLEAAWSFNDNWVTNVTTVGAILTGIFGSTSVATAFLGPEAESSIALAIVGAAIALAFVAAGPLVLLATKSFKSTGTPPSRGNYFTVIGLLLAGAIILTSALGQLWVARATGGNLDLGGLEDWLWAPFGAAVLLLLLYVWRSLLDLLERGVADPLPPTPTAMDAAKLIVEALPAKKDIDKAEVEEIIEQANLDFPPGPTSPGDSGTDRSALI
jgi:hypothetical protein